MSDYAKNRREETPEQRYRREKTTNLYIRLFKNTEKDIIEKLDSMPNKSGYVKDLIRKDVESKKKNDIVSLTGDELSNLISEVREDVKKFGGDEYIIASCTVFGNSERFYSDYSYPPEPPITALKHTKTEIFEFMTLGALLISLQNQEKRLKKLRRRI